MMLRKDLLCADYNVRSKIMGIALKNAYYVNSKTTN